MQYQAAKFANSPATFRDAFKGYSVTLVNGDTRPASRVTDKQVRDYLVDSVYHPNCGWVTADQVADYS